jgi:hypothetical protein
LSTNYYGEKQGKNVNKPTNFAGEKTEKNAKQTFTGKLGPRRAHEKIDYLLPMHL